MTAFIKVKGKRLNLISCHGKLKNARKKRDKLKKEGYAIVRIRESGGAGYGMGYDVYARKKK